MEKQKTVWPYIKGYKFNSLLLKNFAYVFILVTLPLLLVLALNYTEFDDVVNNRVMDMNEELLQKSAVVTDNIMVNLLDSLDEMSRFSEVLEVVQSKQVGADYHKKVENALEVVKNHTMTNNFIESVHIYSDVNEMLIEDDGAKHITQVRYKDKWYNIYKQSSMYFPFVLVNHANSIFVCQPVWSAQGERAGLFVLDVDLQKIRDLLENQEDAPKGIFFIMDISGQIMYCNEQEYADWDAQISHEYEADIAKVKAGQSQMVTDHGKRIVSVMESIHQSWRYALVTELPNYKAELDVVQKFLLSSLAVGVISSLVVAYLITLLTYRPMKKIMNVIQNPQLHWSEKDATKESNELLYITSSILADRNAGEEIAEQLEDRIRSLRQAQFRALQFQIDPHFLYNTLETIKWSAVEEIGLGNKTSKMLTKVARLYRLGLENDDVIVSLKEELDFLKLYIEIVQIRFGDSIQFHWKIDESLHDRSLIKLCLQPIVENAIQHGLRPHNYRGNITISAYTEKDRLCLSVENDGQNMTPAEIKRLNETLITGAGFEESKVGLRNVNERIKLIYGKEYGVSIHTVKTEGETPGEQGTDVRVVLTFPCRKFYRSEEKK